MPFTQQMRDNARRAAADASRHRAAAARRPPPDLAASIARLFPDQPKENDSATTE